MYFFTLFLAFQKLTLFLTGILRFLTQKFFEKLRIEILKTLDDQNSGYTESTKFFE